MHSTKVDIIAGSSHKIDSFSFMENSFISEGLKLNSVPPNSNFITNISPQKSRISKLDTDSLILTPDLGNDIELLK
jgi:hypothetical protein